MPEGSFERYEASACRAAGDVLSASYPSGGLPGRHKSLPRHALEHLAARHRNATAVAQVVKAHAKRAGFDPSEPSGHSLRAGFVTSAAEKGATADRIIDDTG